MLYKKKSYPLPFAPMQLVCISVHILAVISIAAIDESLMLEWVSDKIEGFTTAGMLHTRSYFSFLLCIVAWPLLTIGGEDPYYIKWVCLVVFCTFVGLSTLPWGAVGIINYVLHPQLQVRCILIPVTTVLIFSIL